MRYDVHKKRPEREPDPKFRGAVRKVIKAKTRTKLDSAAGRRLPIAAAIRTTRGPPLAIGNRETDARSATSANTFYFAIELQIFSGDHIVYSAV